MCSLAILALFPGLTGNEAIAIPTGKFFPAEDEEGPFHGMYFSVY